MPVAHCANRGDVGAVDGGEARVRGREGLEVPVGRAVRLDKAVVGQERKTGPLEARGEHDDVRVDKLLVAGPALGHALRAVVDVHAALVDALDVAADPLGLAVAQLLHNVRVDHGGVGEEADAGGRNLLEVAVEELAEQQLGDPGEDGLLAKDVHAEEGVDDHVARDDPLLGSREDGDFGGALGDAELEGLDGGRAAADDGHFLALGVTAGGCQYESCTDWGCGASMEV